MDSLLTICLCAAPPAALAITFFAFYLEGKSVSNEVQIGFDPEDWAS